MLRNGATKIRQSKISYLDSFFMQCLPFQLLNGG